MLIRTFFDWMKKLNVSLRKDALSRFIEKLEWLKLGKRFDSEWWLLVLAGWGKIATGWLGWICRRGTIVNPRQCAKSGLRDGREEETHIEIDDPRECASSNTERSTLACTRSGRREVAIGRESCPSYGTERKETIGTCCRRLPLAVSSPGL